jgi:lysyl-tRNA synthetase class 2
VGEDETLDLAANDEERYFQLMVELVEPGLAALDHAVFLVDYPASQASLARKRPDDPRVAERFELYVGGIELCNGFGELTDPVEQRARLERDRQERSARGLPVYPIDEKFVDSLKHVPPSGGNALGIDRLVALVCGGTEIRKVMSFTVEDL